MRSRLKPKVGVTEHQWLLRMWDGDLYGVAGVFEESVETTIDRRSGMAGFFEESGETRSGMAGFG